MASRNVSACDNDENSDSEVTALSGLGAVASKPLVHYGDRMPYRQGKRRYHAIILVQLLG